MKTKKMISTVFASLLIMVFCLSASISSAQTKKDSTMMMKDCCMMKDGKMMRMKDGKIMPMDKDATMNNGTKCMVNGECIMKDGKKIKMKEGECMDMSGNMDKCEMMNKNTKKSTETKNDTKNATIYTCSMHPEITSDKPGKCPKCGMELIEKK